MKQVIISLVCLLATSISFEEQATVLACPGDNTFTGSTSTDWGTSSNWSEGCVPADDGGTITGTITIASDCVVSSGNSANYTFGSESSLVIEDGITLTNNGTGTWSIDEMKGNGTYCENLPISGSLKPGEDCYGGLHPAFSEFNSSNVTIYVSGNNVVIETNGLPDHTSPYWADTNPLNIDPVCTTEAQMSPGDIDNFNGSFSLTIPIEPALAANSSSTGLGAIGIARSGSVIYNDEEGPNVPLDNAVGSLDCNGAHTGPQSYHYHLEPVAWSEDDQNLIGVMSDGFFIYGRKCQSTGTYPTDLDASGGHTSRTQHCSEEHYHYHIENELYLNEYYILFPGDYQGTPNGIN